MAINYSPIGWDVNKYVNPTNMNQMDDGIKAACDAIDNDVLLKSGGTISGNLVVNGSYTLLDNMIGKKLIVLNRTDDNAGIILGNQSATGYYGYVGMAKNGYMATLTPDTLTASRTHKLPDASGTIALKDDVVRKIYYQGSYTNPHTISASAFTIGIYFALRTAQAGIVRNWGTTLTIQPFLGSSPSYTYANGQFTITLSQDSDFSIYGI